MQIASVEVVRVRIPLARPYLISRGRVDAFTNLLVRVHGADGVSGLGECALLSLLGDIDLAERELRQMGRRIVGMDSREVEAIVAMLDPGTTFELGPLAAIDLALWDLNGRELGVPAYVLLGGLVRRAMPVDFTIGQDDPAVMADRAAEMMAVGGFTGFCVKVGGRSSTVALDVARVRAVRERVGPAVRLRVDANGGYDRASARAFARDVARDAIDLIEQPLPADDLDGLRELARATDIPISIDEGLQRLPDAVRLVETGAVGMFNVKIPKCGGLLLSKKIAAVAEAAGIPVICGGGLAFEVIRQASRHFTASTPVAAGSLHHEGPGPASQGLVGDVTARVLTYDDVRRSGGLVEVGDEPGLGVAEDPVSVGRFAVTA